MIRMYCTKKGFRASCQMRRAKTKPFKFWCFVCGKYVLGDKYHKIDVSIPSDCGMGSILGVVTGSMYR